mmetsp:Transcript_129232/g.235086  ORF Transcript_129232/g.235086 Transcript_129232/m.235086 type:complete len:81 (+) Transcript_129232:1087-1329(+)
MAAQLASLKSQDVSSGLMFLSAQLASTSAQSDVFITLALNLTSCSMKPAHRVEAALGDEWKLAMVQKPKSEEQSKVQTEA